MKAGERQALRLIAACALTAAIGMGCIATLTPSQDAGPAPYEEVPITELLPDDDNAVDEWMDSLPDERRSVIDRAYESSVASGYRGGKGEWVATRVFGRFDSEGGIVVILPDGEEFGAAASIARENDGGLANVKNDRTGDRKDPTSSSAGAGTQIDLSKALLSVGTVHAVAGEEHVALPVRIENNPGILGMTLTVSYDEAAMTLVDSEIGAALKGVLTLTHSRSYQSGCVFTWDGVKIAPEDVHDGSVLVLYFNVAKGARAGIYSVALQDGGSAFDNDLHEIDITLRDGTVVID